MSIYIPAGNDDRSGCRPAYHARGLDRNASERHESHVPYGMYVEVTDWFTIPPMPAAPTTALLTLTPERGAPRPPLTHALPWAEALHAALVRLSDPGDDRGPSQCLTGRDDFGQPLTGHRHAYVLPLSLAADNTLDHALIHAPMGLDPAARAALTRVDRLWITPRAITLHIELAALGQREDLAARVPALRPAAAWRSVTPFVAPRHIKANGRNTVVEQIQTEITAHGLPRAVDVDVETDDTAGPPPRWARFILQRRAPDRKPPVRMGFGVRLRFAEPVPGPLVLGYAAHFGVGQLAPA